jgi:hypothetical protein
LVTANSIVYHPVFLPDSTAVDTIITSDTVAIDNNALESEVVYTARDSIRFDVVDQKVYLFGKAKVTFETTELEAGYIEYSFKDNMVNARGIKDSLGNTVENPVFKNEAERFDCEEIAYNFETKKGKIKQVTTQVADGHIRGNVVMKDNDDVVYIKNAEYCPCKDPKASTYFKVTKLKIIKDDKIITGPGYLAIGGIPTPLAFPFGYFPNKKAGESGAGIIVPQYGESPTLGFYLLNVGYYLPIGKKFDTQILGDIYSKGSWGLKNITRYNSKYKFNGTLNFSFSKLKTSDPEFPDFAVSKEFFFRWRHNQDPKARPGSRFSANVNLGSINNFQNNFNSTNNDYLSNTFQSSISYSKSFPGKLISSSLQMNLRHNQNTVNRIVNLTLPDIAYNANRFYPFSWANKSGVKKWYDKIGMTYTANMKNDISAPDSIISLNNINGLINNNMRNGMQQRIGATTSGKLGYFTFNPAINYTERWYIQSLNKYWDNDLDTSITDTLSGFKTNRDLNMNMSITTKLYGFYEFKRGKIYQIRHVLTPSLNFRYVPAFNTDVTGFFGENASLSTYSPFDIGIYGKSPSSESGLISLNLVNNLEMKLRTPNDTLKKYKKVKILENFSFFGSYDIAKDSLNFSVIGMSGRTRLFKNLNVNYNTTFDPYAYTIEGTRFNTSAWENSGRLGRFMNGTVAVSTSLRSKNKKTGNLTSDSGSEQELNYINANPEEYIDFNIPWSLNLSYSFNFSRSFIDTGDTLTYNQTARFSGDFNLTPKWKIGFTSGYDFVDKALTYTTIDVYRDLNCWEMRFNWVPYGVRKSYNLQINIKSALLQDLKLSRRRSWYDNQ